MIIEQHTLNSFDFQLVGLIKPAFQLNMIIQLIQRQNLWLRFSSVLVEMFSKFCKREYFGAKFAIQLVECFIFLDVQLALFDGRKPAEKNFAMHRIAFN